MGFLFRSSIAAVLFLLLIGAGFLVYLYQWASTPLPLPEPVVIELAPGESFGAFAEVLQSAGVVERGWLFTAYARSKGQTNRIQAGEYRVTNEATPESLLAELVAGAVVTYELRIVEGSTITQVLNQLGETDRLVNDLGSASAATLMSRLQLGSGHAEGQFFPATYDFKKGTLASVVLLRANERMRDVLAHEWSMRAAGLPYATPDDALIMASIIEKETGREIERGKISRVFVSRLQRQMRLQTDPAVIYGVGSAFDGNLTRAHLDADNPYNTYRQAGLPPTPIALPGMASIKAALHPDDGDYLYFVAKGDGSSEFSATLDEHTAAVRRYQLNGDDP